MDFRRFCLTKPKLILLNLSKPTIILTLSHQISLIYGILIKICPNQHQNQGFDKDFSNVINENLV